MAYFGELISIGVAFSWTATALLSEFGSKRLGNLTLNVLRMGLTLLFSLVMFWVVTGTPLPPVGSFEACGWMLLSGVVGFSLLLCFREGFRPLRQALHDAHGLSVATATTIFGPFVGVGFSLMAVQYTSAGIASTLMALTPILIILPSYWLFRQPVTWRSVLGAVISVLGVTLFFLG